MSNYYDGDAVNAKTQQASLSLGPTGPGQYIPPTDRQILEQKKAGLERALALVTKALEAIDAHPEMEQYSNILKAAMNL